MKPSFSTHFQESAPWLQTILNDYQNAVIIADKQFNILNWNTAAELLCRQPGMLINKNFLTLLVQLFPGQPLAGRQLQMALTDGEPDDVILAGAEGDMYRLSCYTDKLPGTQYVLDIVIIIRKLETAVYHPVVSEPQPVYHKEKVQQQITKAIITAQDHERNEISKELHDNVNQLLSSAVIMISAVEENAEDNEHLIEKTSHYLQLAIQEIRKISKSLNSSVIKELGLKDPIQDIIGNLKVQHVEVEFDFDPLIEVMVSHDLQLMLYRIIQEQTNNILRHSVATRVVISLRKTNNYINLTIADNGKGCDLQQPPKGIGLVNIRNRVEAFNGTMHVATKPAQGYRLTVSVPVKY